MNEEAIVNELKNLSESVKAMRNEFAELRKDVKDEITEIRDEQKEQRERLIRMEQKTEDDRKERDRLVHEFGAKENYIYSALRENQDQNLARCETNHKLIDARFKGWVFQGIIIVASSALTFVGAWLFYHFMGKP